MTGRPTWTVLAGVCAAVLLSAGSCVDDVAKGSKTLARGADDVQLDAGVRQADELLLDIPQAVRPSLGARLQSGVRELTSDPDVQQALEGMAWQATCEIVFGRVLDDTDSVAQFLLGLSVSFGIEFLDEGAQLLAETVLDALEEGPDEAVQACEQLGAG